MLPVQLPYYRSTIPQDDLPTKLEIENAITKLPCIRDPRFMRVIAIVDKYVVKYGSQVSENEGNALLYLERELDIPAPRLYAMYREDGRLYIVMEFLRGEALSYLWPNLSPEEKTDITTQLRQIFGLIRALPSPGTLGNVTNGPLPHRFFFSMVQDPQINGPFRSGRELALALALHSRRNWAENGRHGWTSDYFQRHLPNALAGHKGVFTHSDIQRKNILVEKRLSTNGERSGGFIVTGIVDWEASGWYPSYWEYAAAFVDFQWVDDWPAWIEKFVEPCPMEAALLKLVRQDLDY